MSKTNGFIGQPVKRVEDRRFLTGKGNYTDDIVLHGMVYAAFVRSNYAHAKIVSIDVEKAKSMPGVVAIFTGDDVMQVNGVPCGWQVNFKNGETMKEPKHPLLAYGKVRYSGEAVAMVIAETRAHAKDAAEEVIVEYEELPVIVNAAEAVKSGAPLVHDDVPGTFC